MCPHRRLCTRRRRYTSLITLFRGTQFKNYKSLKAEFFPARTLMNRTSGVNNELHKFIAHLLRSNAQVMVRSQAYVIDAAHIHVVLSCVYFWVCVCVCVKGSGCSRIWGRSNHPVICLGGLRNVTRILSQDSWSPGRDLAPKPADKEAGLLTVRQGHSISFGIYREVKSIGWTHNPFGRMITCKARVLLCVN